MNHLAMTLDRPGYANVNGIWKPTGNKVIYKVYYSGDTPLKALERLLQQNTVKHIAEVVKHIAWVNTGYYSVDSMMSVTALGMRREFFERLVRRTGSHKVLAGNMDIDTSRQIIVNALAQSIEKWLREICFEFAERSLVAIREDR